MTKTTQRKKQQKTQKQSPKEFVAALDEMRDKMMKLALDRAIESATKLGEHKARSALIAPIIEDMQMVHTRDPFGSVNLTPSACSIVLACLAEAGYVPAPQGGEEFAFPQSSTGVPGDGAAENGCNTATPVAKAA